MRIAKNWLVFIFLYFTIFFEQIVSACFNEKNYFKHNSDCMYGSYPTYKQDKFLESVRLNVLNNKSILQYYCTLLLTLTSFLVVTLKVITALSVDIKKISLIFFFKLRFTQYKVYVVRPWFVSNVDENKITGLQQDLNTQTLRQTS